jgi:hypothetical protein
VSQSNLDQGQRAETCTQETRTFIRQVRAASRAFRDYLHLVGIHHILALPFHPQTNGKLERYQQSIKQEVNQIPYEMPADLEQAIAKLITTVATTKPWVM